MMNEHEKPAAAEQELAFTLKAGASLWSLGYLSQEMQCHPTGIMAVVKTLGFEPLSIDGIPFLMGPQVDLVRAEVARVRQQLAEGSNS